MAGPGICGKGVYGFECRASAGTETEALSQAWQRSQVGGYNQGCLIVYRPHGIMVNMPREVSVPGGAHSHKKDQFASNESSMEFLTVTFDVDGLVHCVEKQLDKLGPLHLPRACAQGASKGALVSFRKDGWSGS